MSPLEKNLLHLIEAVLAESQIFLDEKGREAIIQNLGKEVPNILSQTLLEEINKPKGRILKESEQP